MSSTGEGASIRMSSASDKAKDGFRGRRSLGSLVLELLSRIGDLASAIYCLLCA